MLPVSASSGCCGELAMTCDAGYAFYGGLMIILLKEVDVLPTGAFRNAPLLLLGLSILINSRCKI